MPASSAATEAETDLSRTERHFRPELEGLRFVAVLMVVTYHIWLGRVSGGVDVFLMISALLLTGSFVRRFERGRRFDLGRHYLHRFKRLLPAAVVTVLGTLGATRLFLPASRWGEVQDQAWATVLYVQNWLLAERSVDYYAGEHATASPLQHFWSLSIQGQVFILWPLIFAAVAFLARRLRVSYRLALAVTFGAVFAGSLAYSVLATAHNQQYAYFDTRARLWEFAAGSLLALVLPSLHLPRAVRVALGWAGVLAMLAVGVLLPVETSFPGTVALWPIAAAGAVIVAGTTGARFGVDRVLASRPLVRLGGISYALYLVHWPALVVYLSVTGQDRPSFAAGCALIAGSLAAAWALTRFVEQPVRNAAWTEASLLRMALVITASVLAVAVPLAGWQIAMRQQAQAARANQAQDNPGAAAVYAGAPVAEGVAPVPSPADQPDWFDLPQECSGRLRSADPAVQEQCRQGAPVTDPTKVVVAIGDSHTQQWLAALEPIAAERGWQLVSVLFPGCNVGDPQHSSQPEGCAQWLPKAYDYVLGLRPDAVYTITTNSYPGSLGAPEAAVPGYLETARRFMDAGIDVIGIRDNPRWDEDVYECVTRNADTAACRMPVEYSMAPANPAAQALAGTGVYSLDLTDLVCPDGTCTPVVGNVYTYFDDHHLTATYLRTMSPELERRLAEAGFR